MGTDLSLHTSENLLNTSHKPAFFWMTGSPAGRHPGAAPPPSEHRRTRPGHDALRRPRRQTAKPPRAAPADPAVLSTRAPGTLGLAEACCDRWADGTGRLALIRPRRDATAEAVSFDALHDTSCRIAQVMRGRGIGRGDRVAILLPQGPEAVIALLAAWRIGAIAVPLARMLDGPALAFRLNHAGVAAFVTDAAGLAATQALRPALPALRMVLGTEGAQDGALCFWAEAGRAPRGAPDAAIAPGDPALILYTAGALGQARGVLHAHRALAGQLPGVAAQHGGFPLAGDRVWTPMDWAWRSGMFDALLPALCQGVPVLAAPLPRFAADQALELMSRHGVRNAVLPATALPALRDALAGMAAAPPLRSIATCGAPPDPAVAAWLAQRLGARLRHGHGTAECHLVLLGGAGPAAAGRAVPGQTLAVVDAAGRPVPDGQAGLLAVRRGHPAEFLGYWKGARGVAGPWLPTGDRATRRADGAIVLEGAVPGASGDGMGPEDVEHCLRRHPAVALAAVVGPADALAAEGDLGGEDATAIIVPHRDATPGPDLAEELRAFMRLGMAGHRYPRRVAFAKALPRAPEGRAALGSAVGLGGRRG